MSSKSKWFKGSQKRGASNKAALEESKFFRDLNRELIKSLSDMEDENAKLRDVVAQMYRDMQGVLDMSTDTVFVDSIGTLRDRMDLHMQAMAELGMPPADYEKRMRELGMEADE